MQESFMESALSSHHDQGQALLYLTDEQLRQGIEAMFFAYRGFTADPDRILEQFSYGRAHHRALALTYFSFRQADYDGRHCRPLPRPLVDTD